MNMISPTRAAARRISVLLCCVLAVTARIVAEVQNRPPSQEILIEQLNSSDWSVRRVAATRILAIAAPDRTPELIDAVIRELNRLETLKDLGVSEVPKGADYEAAWDYYGDLIEVACRSDDPAVIPPLANALAMGHPVIDALARFGAPAVAPVLTAVATHPRPEFNTAAMYAFRLLVQAHPDLPVELREKISVLAREHLAGRQLSGQVNRAIDLAAVLKDKNTTRVLQVIASARTARDAGLDLVDSVGTKRDPFVALRQQAASALSSMRR